MIEQSRSDDPVLPDVLPEEGSATANVHRQHCAAFDEVDGVLQLVLGILTPGSSLKVSKTRDLDRASVLLVMGLLSKMVKTTRAIERVCAGGLGQDAVSLLRVHFETFVAISWLLQRSTKRRTKLYLAYGPASAIKTLNAWKRRKGLKRQATRRLFAA